MNAACLPPFSWSHTRDRIFSTCARRYYLRYYAGAGGWRTDADPACRQAYALRHLTTFELALGLEIHQRAREIAAAVREHRAPSTLAALRERTRAAMNQLYRRRDVEAFLADPKRFPLRMEVFYGRGTDPERLERVRAKMELCLEALHGCCLWGELAELGRRDILMVDRLSTLTVDDIPVYAAPDLVYRSDTGHVIVEWKTGRDPFVREQTALYGLFVRDGLGVPCAEGRLHVRLFRLDLATEETWEITAPDRRPQKRGSSTAWPPCGACCRDPRRTCPSRKVPSLLPHLVGSVLGAHSGRYVRMRSGTPVHCVQERNAPFAPCGCSGA